MAARLEEIEAVYRTRYAVFLRVAIAILGEEQIARDAVHDGFVRAVMHRGRWRGEAPLEAWIWRIVVNAARKRQLRESRILPAGQAAERSLENGSSDPVRMLIAALPERQRLVLFLRYYADLDYRSIGAALGIAGGTVAATLNAAHANVRKGLEVEECQL